MLPHHEDMEEIEENKEDEEALRLCEHALSEYLDNTVRLKMSGDSDLNVHHSLPWSVLTLITL